MQEHPGLSVSVVLAPHRRIGIFFLISSVLLLSLLTIGWTSFAEVTKWDEPIIISETENIRVEDIAAFEGEVFIVAMGVPDAGYGVFLRHFDGQRWSDWIPLHGDRVHERYGHPKVTVGGDGVAHIVWIDYNDDQYNVMYRSYDGSLGPEMNLSEGWSDAYYFEDACDVAAWNDEVYVTWCGGGTGDGIFLRHYDGTHWGDVETIDDSPFGSSNHPSIATDDGEVWIAWIGYPQRGDSDVLCRRFDGESWHPAEVISRPAGIESNHEVDITFASGQVHVAWRAEGISKPLIHQRSNLGGSWGEISVFNSTPPMGVYNPDISAEGDNIVLSWQDQRDSSSPIILRSQDIYLRIDNGTGWGEEEQVNTEILNASCHDAIVSVGDDVLHITWCWWNQTLRRIYYRRCPLEAFPPESKINDTSTIWWVQEESTEIDWSAEDDNGLDTVDLLFRYSSDNIHWSEWSIYSSSGYIGARYGQGTVVFNPPNEDGFYELSVKAVDLSERIETGKPITEKLIIYDTTSPSGSVVLNGGAVWTISIDITVDVSAVDHVTNIYYAGQGGHPYQVRLSNDNVTWSDWDNLTRSISWSLTDGDGLKTVFCQVMDGAGHASEVYEDSITLDTTPPIVEDTIPQDFEVVFGREFSVHVYFNESMDQSSAEGSFRLSERLHGDELRQINGTFEWMEDDRMLFFVPEETTSWDQVYVLEIGVDAKDVAGNKLETPFVIAFRTGIDESRQETMRWAVGWGIVALLIIGLVVVGVLMLRTHLGPRRPFLDP